MFSKVKTFFAEHRKVFVAAAGVILTIAAQQFPDSPYVTAAVAIATIFGVHQIPNQPPAK